jgi:hypothetical protein
MPTLDSTYTNDRAADVEAAMQFFGTGSYVIEKLADVTEFQPRFELASDNLDELEANVPSPADHALSQLRQIKHWPANWDGEEAPRPNTANIDLAISLLSIVAQKRLAFGVGLDSESRPMLSLRDRPYEGHMLIEAEGRISFYFRHGEGALHDYDLEFDGRTLPVSLENALNKI